MHELKQYQLDAVTAIGEHLQKSLHEASNASTMSEATKNRASILKSPTGSGKTLMMSAIIERYLSDAITLIFSPGAGSLETQTQHSLERFLANTPVHVKELTEANIASVPTRGTVFVKNWDALTKTNKDGMFTNRLSRDSETVNIFDFVKLVTTLRIPMVIMVDESHYGKKSEATNVFKFLEYLHDTAIQAGGSRIPIVEFSATPVVTEYSFKHVVTLEESIQAGLNRESIVINDGVSNLDVINENPETVLDTEEILLRGACEKLLELEGYYEEAGSAYRPLMGIQLPSSALGKEARERIESFLEKEYGWTVDNGNVAVFMHEAKAGELENIATPESKVRVLLYKQAIATGWDCPRAQVFVGFRHIKSRTFTEQNLGRYCRTTEARHYTALDTPNYEALNQMYAYTNYSETAYLSESTLLSSGELKASQVLHVNPALQDSVDYINSLRLPQSYVMYKQSRKLSTEVRKLMKAVHEKHPTMLDNVEGVYYDQEVLQSAVVDFSTMGSKNVDRNVTGEIKTSISETQVKEEWTAYIHRTLREALGGQVTNFNTIAQEVGKNLAIRVKRATQLPDVLSAMRAVLYNQANHEPCTAYLRAFATEAKPYIIDGELNNTYEPTVRRRGHFTLPAMLMSSTNEPYGNLLVTKQFYTNTLASGGVVSYRPASPPQPEVRFENMLLETFGANNPYVEFTGMHKNGEKVADENFVNAIVIPVRGNGNRLRNFFPDYLLTFYNKETGQTIPMIVEVKGSKSHDNDDLLHAKTVASQYYMEKTGLPFVVAKEKEPGVFVINENESVTFENFVNTHKEDIITPVGEHDDCDWIIPEH